jgi:hypothetical protein
MSLTESGLRSPLIHQSHRVLWSTCYRPWGSVIAGAHVSCAIGQESTICLSLCLGSLLFDPFATPLHIYHFLPIIDVARIHLMDCLISIPLMRCSSVHTASLYFYIRSPLLALRMASRVSCLTLNLLPCPLLPVAETVPSYKTYRLVKEAVLYPFSSLPCSTLRNSRYSLRAHYIGGDST